MQVDLWERVQGSDHVVRLLGCYEDADRVFLVQELCTGGDLLSVTKAGALSEQCAAAVIHSVLEVLRECHAHRLAYGDVKVRRCNPVTTEKT